MNEWSDLVLICILNYALTSLSLLYSVRSANQRQALAYNGDAQAAKRIILPCFKPLFQGLIVFYATLSVVLCLTYSDPTIKGKYFHVLQYFNFCSMGTYIITPVLLVQSSVSLPAFWNTAYIVIPWWLLCTALWGFSYVKDRSQFILSVLFVFFGAVPPIILSILILTKLIKSRVQLGSVSNRNSIEFLLSYSLVYGIAYLVAIIGISSDDKKFILTAVVTAVSFLFNQIFPFALYRTLLADTKFWRGLGRHNKMGINIHDDLRESGVSVFRPTMDLSVISSTFQDMMAGIGDISIDFAYLQLERIIGHGATSEVYCGRYKKKLVAIKLSNPPEVTEEAMDVFVAEAKIASSLKHPNIVEFIGICVRPPQIAMVFEFCEGGNLKSNLQKNKQKWTPIKRLIACLDACRAIEAFHSEGLIHRDLKAENFFVGRKQIVKLGDFGESTHRRTEESTKTKRMTILGTVAFMAPELIAAKRHYTEAIDIYALAITLWEIWTGKDPYEDISQFDIYAKVAEGYRPPLPTDAPEGFTDALTCAWQEDAQQRPSAAELLSMLEKVHKRFISHGSRESEDDQEEEGSGGQGDGGNGKNKENGNAMKQQNDSSGGHEGIENPILKASTAGTSTNSNSNKRTVSKGAPDSNHTVEEAAVTVSAAPAVSASARPTSHGSTVSDIELSAMRTASNTTSASSQHS